jgi:tRNA pseudouridine55 synthase
MDGLLLIDKPAGWTSHDAVAYVRRALGEKRAGHTGTLDPGATGLLLVLVGKATRLARYFSDDDKEYLAVMRLGAETDTEDAAGRVTMECPVPELSREDIEAVFGRFTGVIDQTPPMYSAVKQDGKPLYKKARAGEEIERSPRKVAIKRLELLQLNGTGITFSVLCTKGTYVRTLCRDMGEALGSCAHMGSLRRTTAGNYQVSDAVSLESRPSGEELSGRLLPMKDLLPGAACSVVTASARARVKDGVSPHVEDMSVQPARLRPGEPVKVLDEAGELIAVGEAADDMSGRTPYALKVVLV